MKNNWKIVFAWAVVVGGGLSLLASSSPDGLEKVAEVQGFLGQGKQLFVVAIPDYSVPGIYDASLATSLAGIIGTSVVFLVMSFLGRYLYRFERSEK